MSDPWFLLESPPGAADWNMALDEALLEAAARVEHPVLRFYGWREEAASFGYFQKYADVEQMTGLRPLIRRPTGGGLVPHKADWTYSLTIPPSHPWYALRAEESYRRMHEWICDAFGALGVETSLAPCCQKELPGQCFAGAEKFDLLWHGRKLAGAAQRRTRNGLLIQGSIQPQPPKVTRAAWQQAMCDVASRQQGVNWLTFAGDAATNKRAEELARVKYSQNQYNRRR